MKRTKRDIRIELLRILCCFCVVALHCKPGSRVEGNPVFFRFLFSNLIADPVSIFLMITGFYFVNEVSYKKNVFKNIKRILIPIVLYSLFILLISGGFSSASSAKDSFIQLGRCILTWTPLIHNTGHLWYLYVHLFLIFLSPLIQYVLSKVRANHGVEHITIILIFILFWLNDSVGNKLFRCSQIPITSLLPSILILLLGNIIYDLMSGIGPKYRPAAAFISLACYIGINLYRAELLTKGTIQMSDATFSLLGVLCAFFVCVFVLCFPKKDEPISHPINWLSSYTLDIYIWHVIAMELTYQFGLKTWFITLVTDGTESNSVYLRYIILYSLLIMFLCIVWAFLLRQICFFFMRIVAGTKKDTRITQ